MLGRETIIDARHRALRVAREPGGERVVRVYVTDDPAAAVKVHEKRQRSARACRAVNACGERSALQRNVDVFDDDRVVALARVGPRDVAESLADRCGACVGPERRKRFGDIAVIAEQG